MMATEELETGIEARADTPLSPLSTTLADPTRHDWQAAATAYGLGDPRGWLVAERAARRGSDIPYSLYPSSATAGSAAASRSNVSLSISPATSRPATAARDDPTEARPSPLSLEGSTTASEPVVQDFQDRYMSKGKEPQSPTFTAEASRTITPNTASMSTDDEPTSAVQDFTAIHVPIRTSSKDKAMSGPSGPRSRGLSAATNNTLSTPDTPDSPAHNSAERSSADSVISYQTEASSIGTLPPLQTKGPPDEHDRMDPLLEDDPRNFDLLAPIDHQSQDYSLERRVEQILSKRHLQEIFADPPMLHHFTSFLSNHRPQSLPLLIYYLDALKALRAINYANAVAEALEPIDGLPFTEHPARPTINSVLEDKAQQAFQALVDDDLPAYVSHVWVQVVSMSIHMRITGTQPPHLREASEGLAETFCLTDPSRKDNPIVFASEEFYRTTQYGVSYAIGRNCRFLQGPHTSRHTIDRLSRVLREGRECSEVILNYRRDGSPFLNLLMMAPLLDSKGNVRYFVGSQIDVSGLARDCTDLPALKRVIAKEEAEAEAEAEGQALPSQEEERDEFLELSEMLNINEVETVRKFGGRMHREQEEESSDDSSIYRRPRLLLKDGCQSSEPGTERLAHGRLRSTGKIGGIYQHYLLVRPHPSLRIIFTSPSLRVPGMLQSPFLNRIGGSFRVREELVSAMAEGRGVTAKVRWVSGTRSEDEGRSRWIHCTPLLGQNGAVGVWMVVLVDDNSSIPASGRKLKLAPPVSGEIGARKNSDSDTARRERQGSNAARRRSHIIDTMALNKHERTPSASEFDLHVPDRRSPGFRSGSRLGAHSSAGGSLGASLDSFKI